MAKWRFKAYIIKWCYFLATCSSSSVNYSPFCKLSNTIGLLLVPFILFNLKVSVTFKSHKIAFDISQTNCTAKCHWICWVTIFKFKYDQLFIFWNFKIWDLFRLDNCMTYVKNWVISFCYSSTNLWVHLDILLIVYRFKCNLKKYQLRIFTLAPNYKWICSSI